MMVEDTTRTYAQYLSISRGGYYPDYRAKIYHILVIRVKLQLTVRWITNREKGRVLQPG